MPVPLTQALGPRMRRASKIGIWILLNLATIPVAFYLSIGYWTSLVQDEYRTGARVSTDGDSVMIPVMGTTIPWVLFLCLLNVAILIAFVVRARFARLS